MTYHNHLGRGRSILPLLLVSSGAVLCSGELSAQQAELTDTQKAIHVLNRLGYGPRPGDIEKIKAMGSRPTSRCSCTRSASPTQLPMPS